MATRKNMTEEVGKEIVKKRQGANSPVIGNNGLMVEPGDNARYLGVTMALGSLPKIDLRDVSAVEERLREYFEIHAQNDMKPTVAGLGLALNGMDRHALWGIRTDNPINGKGDMTHLPREVVDAIKKAYRLLENLWENYMQNGKINPVSGIFLGKNQFAYQDKTEYVLTPNRQNDSDFNADEIRARYLTDSQSE